MARRIADGTDIAVLRVEDLTKEALRAAFASWAADHAAASVLRAHSSWSSFFDYLVAEDLLEGATLAAVRKPRRVASSPRAIRSPDAATQLLAIADKADPRGRDPWPERDLALTAMFCVTGIREAEAVALGMGSIEGDAGAGRLQTLLGHASLDTTRRYLDATAEGLRDVLRTHPGQIALRVHVRRKAASPDPDATP